MAMVCQCHEVSTNAIRAAVQAGARTVSDVQDATWATTSCGGCIEGVCHVVESTLKTLLTGAAAQH
jgi:NAD(P)H-nitrite reductase large subunit